MKFCMITTFFGAHSFGGDAAYVDRENQARVPGKGEPRQQRLEEISGIGSRDAGEDVIRLDRTNRPVSPAQPIRQHSIDRLGFIGAHEFSIRELRHCYTEVLGQTLVAQHLGLDLPAEVR